MTNVFDVFGRTEAGPVRAANEDHILLGRFVKNRGGMGLRIQDGDDFLAAFGLLLAVADGVGGEAGGSTASRAGLNALEARFYGVEKCEDACAVATRALHDAAGEANRSILDLAAKRPELTGMGATLAGVCLLPGAYLVFHAGDSRVYRFRNGALKQLTNDDSIVALAVEAGRMSVSETEQSPVRNTITNSLGAGTFELHVQQGPALRSGDVLLICSDGVHDMLTHEAIESIVERGGPSEKTVDALLEASIASGGHDNISAIVARYTSAPPSA
ncbi:MAG: hypothetical protein GWP08_00475 [Nitrospiraceae bacterium]|nr:hypothetical protein [Nitrospiraceae bacterium]